MELDSILMFLLADTTGERRHYMVTLYDCEPEFGYTPRALRLRH